MKDYLVAKTLLFNSVKKDQSLAKSRKWKKLNQLDRIIVLDKYGWVIEANKGSLSKDHLKEIMFKPEQL